MDVWSERFTAVHDDTEFIPSVIAVVLLALQVGAYWVATILLAWQVVYTAQTAMQLIPEPGRALCQVLGWSLSTCVYFVLPGVRIWDATRSFLTAN